MDLALNRIFRLNNDKNLLNYINGIIRYENTLYDSKIENWKDLREGRPKSMCGWCNGASGIGLARLEFMKNENLVENNFDYIENAFKSTLKYGFETTPGICHGSATSLILLKELENYIPNLENLITEKEESILITKSGYNSIESMPSNLRLYNLWLGDAGISYSLNYSNKNNENLLLFN